MSLMRCWLCFSELIYLRRIRCHDICKSGLGLIGNDILRCMLR